MSNKPTLDEILDELDNYNVAYKMSDIKEAMRPKLTQLIADITEESEIDPEIYWGNGYEVIRQRAKERGIDLKHKE